MSESVDAKEKQPGKPMIIAAAILLFGIWLTFLSPWVQFQFWQSDTFWLIETGRLILEKHCLPTHDIYSFTASAPHWTVYQWLAEVIFSLANDIGGLSGVSLVGEVLLAILFCVLMFREMLKNGISAVVTIGVIWLAAFSFFPDLSSLRPQLFSFLLFWLLAVVCADIKAGVSISKVLLRTFIIVVVWANCHISFLVGLVMLVANFFGSLLLYLLKKTDKKQQVLFAAAITTFLIATFFTPFGLSLWSFLVKVNNVYYTQEVLPLAWATQPRLIAVAVASLCSCWYLAKKPDPGSILALLALLSIGNNCGRLIIYFCILSCPAIGFALNQCLSKLLN